MTAPGTPLWQRLPRWRPRGTLFAQDGMQLGKQR